MNNDKNNLERDLGDSNVNESEKGMNGDLKANEEEKNFSAENEGSKRKITIEKGKKPIDFDDLFF